MLRRLVCSVVILWFVSNVVSANEHPLLVGVRLAETRFRDWRYGHRVYRQQVDCVQFVAAVVEELLQRGLLPEERSSILINNVGRRRHLKNLILQNDKRIRGIQTALVQMGKGEIIKPSEAEPGDFIQFWRQRNGRWYGHAAIVVDVFSREGSVCSLVFGSQQSNHGVGIGNFEVGLNDPNIKAYVVRFKN